MIDFFIAHKQLIKIQKVEIYVKVLFSLTYFVRASWVNLRPLFKLTIYMDIVSILTLNVYNRMQNYINKTICLSKFHPVLLNRAMRSCKRVKDN